MMHRAIQILAKARAAGKVIPDDCEVFTSDTCFRKYRCNQCEKVTIFNYHLIQQRPFNFATNKYGEKERIGIFCKQCAVKLGLVALAKPNADVVIRRGFKGTAEPV